MRVNWVEVRFCLGGLKGSLGCDDVNPNYVVGRFWVGRFKGSARNDEVRNGFRCC